MKNKLGNFINLYKNRCFFSKKNGAGFTLLNAALQHRALKVLSARYLTGFSLIEVLSSIAILLIIIGIVSTIFLISTQAQRKILVSQELLNSTAHTVEYMSRALRMAKKDLDGVCILAGTNYKDTDRGGVRFINHRDECQEFFLKNGRLKEERDGREQFLTPTGLEIVSWDLYLSGQCEGDNYQPRVTFSFKIKGEGPRPELRPEMKIQTTISQRSLDLKR